MSTPRHDDSSTRHYAGNGMTRESRGSHSGGTRDHRHFGGMTHGSRSGAQSSRPWYHATANTSSRTLNANEESANSSEPTLGGGIDNRYVRDWYTTGILVQFRQRSKNTNQVRKSIHDIEICRFLNIVSFFTF